MLNPILSRLIPGIRLFRNKSWLLILVSSLSQAYSTVVVYPGPEGIQANSDYSVTVDERPLFVYSGKINTGYFVEPPNVMDPQTIGYSYFDFSGRVRVTVEFKKFKTLKSVKIRPLGQKIFSIIEGNTVRFEMDRPANLSVEPDGDYEKAAFLFANPLEENPPSKGDKNVTYYGPGVHEIGEKTIKDHEIVYLAGGAYCKGYLRANNAKNWQVRGRGILDQAALFPMNINTISIAHAENFKIEGIILTAYRGWMVRLNDSREGKIENIKLIGWGQNSDGIDPMGVVDLTVKNCFIRNYDDSICLKSGKNSRLERILFEGCFVFSGWCGGFLKFGRKELQGAVARDITFRNCEMAMYQSSAITIDVLHQTRVSNIKYDQIIVDVLPLPENRGWSQDKISGRKKPKLLNLFVEKWPNPSKPGQKLLLNGKEFGASPIRGSISDIEVKNIYVYGDTMLPSSFQGWDKEHPVKNIRIENIYFNDKKIESIEKLGIEKNEFVENLEFKP